MIRQNTPTYYAPFITAEAAREFFAIDKVAERMDWVEDNVLAPAKIRTSVFSPSGRDLFADIEAALATQIEG